MSLARGAMAKHEGALAAALLALLSAALILPSIRGLDGAGNYVYLMSIFRAGDLDFADDYAAIDQSRATEFKMNDEPRDPSTGRPGNRFGIGAALFWGPAVAVVHAALSLLAPEMATGWGRPYEWAVAVASAWWGCLGAWFLFMRMREEFGSAPAWAASSGILFASALGFYVWAHGSMSHAVSFFISVMALLAFERAIVSGALLSSLTLGMWAGLLVVTRFQDASWAAAFGIGLLIFGGNAPDETMNDPDTGARKEAASFWRVAAAGIYAFGVLLAMLPQMAVWQQLYGSWLAGPRPYFGQGAGELNFLPIHFFQVLASEKGGAFAWHPILIAGLVGLALRFGGAGGVRTPGPEEAALGRPHSPRRGEAVQPGGRPKAATPGAFGPLFLRLPRRGSASSGFLRIPFPGLREQTSARRDAGSSPELPPLGSQSLRCVGLIGIALQLYLVSCWSVWWAGASFGNRFFISSYPFFAWGLARLIASLRPRVSMRWLAAALVILIAWNAGLLIQYGAEMIPREEAAGWAKVLSNQFLEVPEWLAKRATRN